MGLKQKLLISILLLNIIFFIITPIKANAALQANGNGSKTDTIGNWLLNIRKMEETGGTLGLTDTINTTDLTSSASQSNNLDVHMQKNTEYGAMAILSASAYGNPNKINDGETTTGNKSGVYMKMNGEWVSAAEKDMDLCPPVINSNNKYKNLYTGYSTKIGDAIKDTKGWHSNVKKDAWISVPSYSGLIRAYTDSIFSFYGIGNHMVTHYSTPRTTRSVIVIGNGF